jgi:hypothetical protein
MSKYYIDTDNAFPTRDMGGEDFVISISGKVQLCIFSDVATTAVQMAASINDGIKGVKAESILDNQVLRIICDKDFSIVETPKGLTWASFKPLRMADKPKPKTAPKVKEKPKTAPTKTTTARPKPVMPKISKRDED